MKEQNLQLSLLSEWFYMTKCGMKQADYRDITPYWCNRLLLYNGVSKSKKWWQEYLKSNLLFCPEFKHFDYNIMTLGYPKSTDTERILKLEHKGIEIRTGNPLLGAEPNKLYFVIKHGETI